MKVKIPLKRIILMWSVVFIIVAGIVSLMFFNLFYVEKWTAAQPLIIAAYILIMVIILISSLNTHYYEINKRDITECRFGKKFTYFYSDIIYIDEEGSRKSKTLTFVTKYGHVKYLTFDKNGEIFKVALAKCHNLLSLEEIRGKFPGIKI